MVVCIELFFLFFYHYCYGQDRGQIVMVKIEVKLLWSRSRSNCYGQDRGQIVMVKIEVKLLWSKSRSKFYSQDRGQNRS